MIREGESPCGVLFETFKSFAGISNRDLASVVLTDRPLAGGRSPRERIYEDKTYLSRTVVHGKPGDLSPACFADFAESTHVLYSKMRSASKKPLTSAQISEYFAGQGAQEMATACRAFDLDGALYLNTVNHLTLMEGVGDADRSYLLLMLFLETGCLQDAKAAASHVLQHSKRMFNASPVTQTPGAFQDQTLSAAEDVRLALFRVKGNRLSGAPHVLSTGPQGTEIGYLSMAADSITDVEQTVSRHHLLLFRAEDGKWFARGLGSRNGTVLISGDDRSEVLIEPPRSKSEGFVPEDVQIKSGDKLVLARDTIFMVMQIDQ